MVERASLLGVEDIVEVDFSGEHPGKAFGDYHFREHKPVAELDSEEGLSVSELISRVGEHYFSCEECSNDQQVERFY